MASLVSIAVPHYNATDTLPLALASLIAQTYEAWECIIVDDGSTDKPQEIVDIIDDDRIRLHHFRQNYGRAVARQQALDMAQGRYLAMVDADDWIYPDKLEVQVNIMEANPQVAVISSGMAIIDVHNNLTATRQSHKNSKLVQYEAFAKPTLPPFSYPASMIRMDIAKSIGYDRRFIFSEDVDFLIPIIMKHSFGILSDNYYAYREVESYSLHKMIQSIRSNHITFSKYYSLYPYTVANNRLKLLAKAQIYRIFSIIGLESYLIRRRSIQPTETQINAFNDARSKVYQVGKSIFVETPYEHHFDDKPIVS